MVFWEILLILSFRNIVFYRLVNLKLQFRFKAYLTSPYKLGSSRKVFASLKLFDLYENLTSHFLRVSNLIIVMEFSCLGKWGNYSENVITLFYFHEDLYTGVFEVADYNFDAKIKNSKWWIKDGGRNFLKVV